VEATGIGAVIPAGADVAGRTTVGTATGMAMIMVMVMIMVMMTTGTASLVLD
jgi:hypothetical protein